MKIGGFMKQSFVDFPATLSAVIFTNGCNLKCWYCHNSELIDGKYCDEHSLESIYNFLESRKGFLEGVVISGGEPTIQPDLENVVLHIKSMGFKVKLDTNGTNPVLLQKLLPNLDYVAMDIKNSLQNYHKTVGALDITKIKQSIEILKNWDGDYEFRTTFSPDITFLDIEKIGQMLLGCKKYYIQKYNPQSDDAPKQNLKNYEIALKIAKKFVHNSYIR